jgi:hypothetical protein
VRTTNSASGAKLARARVPEGLEDGRAVTAESFRGSAPRAHTDGARCGANCERERECAQPVDVLAFEVLRACSIPIGRHGRNKATGSKTAASKPTTREGAPVGDDSADWWGSQPRRRAGVWIRPPCLRQARRTKVVNLRFDGARHEEGRVRREDGWVETELCRCSEARVQRLVVDVGALSFALCRTGLRSSSQMLRHEVPALSQVCDAMSHSRRGHTEPRDEEQSG